MENIVPPLWSVLTAGQVLHTPLGRCLRGFLTKCWNHLNWLPQLHSECPCLISTLSSGTLQGKLSLAVCVSCFLLSHYPQLLTVGKGPNTDWGKLRGRSSLPQQMPIFFPHHFLDHDCFLFISLYLVELRQNQILLLKFCSVARLYSCSASYDL